jgi:ribonucleotide reductase alpha subunit
LEIIRREAVADSTRLDPTTDVDGHLPELAQPVELSDNARAVLTRRYLRRGENGNPTETVEELLWRVATHVAAPEAQYGGNVREIAERFYHLLAEKRLFPNSPTFTGAGTPLGQLAACFVLPISDDMGRADDGIFQTLRNAALIQQTGGGNGFSFSRLRPGGARVYGGGGEATGPVGFMRVYDRAFGEVAQGGVRRGASIAVLRVDHPDIREFITCKTGESQITNFNISVALTDDFMRAVEADASYALINPQDGSVWETASAREIFELIVRQAHHNGEPGVLFIDTANRANPVPNLYKLEATNPCVTGETRVATPDGWRRVDEIETGDEICTVNGAGRVIMIETHPALPVYDVHFSDGGVVRATAAHQFYICDPDEQTLRPCRVDRLRKGDRVRSYRDGVLEGSAEFVRAEPGGLARVYDLYEPETDSWITEGYVSRGCGEQWLGPMENCCLGSLNLAWHVTSRNRVDWERLQASVEVAVRFLDDVVDANAYVPAVPALKEAAHRVRRIGLGVMGLADVMIRLGIRYGSEEAQEFAGQTMEFVRCHAMRASVALARERGSFPAIAGSIYDPDDFRWELPTPLVPHSRDWGCPELDWESLAADIKRHGIRNGAQTTIAPTGTTSTIAGVEGYGCEPVFALAYVRHFDDNGRNMRLQYASPLFEQALVDAGIPADAREGIIQRVSQTGSCQNVEEIPEEIRRVFVIATDVSPEEHVRMQAALQRFVDNAISKTINMPATAAPEDVAAAYKLAWELGCKGLTVYVAGSRERVVLETRETAANRVQEPELALFPEEPKKPRARMLPGYTFRIETPLGATYVTVNENGDNQPFEVFINTAKAGSDTSAVGEAIGRLISYVLRLRSPVPPSERLKEVVHQLEGIGGRRPLGLGPNRVHSLPDGVAQALDDYLGQRNSQLPTAESAAASQLIFTVGAPIGDLCPECGQATLLNAEGCRKCHTCGFSEC